MFGATYLCQQSVPIPTTKVGDFGFSFSYSDVLQNALEHIHHKKQEGAPPIVWDVACGHGFASLYSLMAGAKEVYSLDTHTIVLKSFRENAPKIKEFLPKGTSIKEQLKLKIFDALDWTLYKTLPDPDVVL